MILHYLLYPNSSHLNQHEDHFLASCLKNHLLPVPTFVMLSLNHQEVVLTLNTSMQGMLPFKIDVQHVLSYFLYHLVLYEHINLFLHIFFINSIYIAMVK
jgi:hypothetical protein